MKITNVNMKKINSATKLRAIASVEFDSSFVVNDIKVMEGNRKTGGIFIGMPCRPMPDGTFKDIAHPINSETRDKIQKIILDSYEEALLLPDMES